MLFRDGVLTLLLGDHVVLEDGDPAHRVRGANTRIGSSHGARCRIGCGFRCLCGGSARSRLLATAAGGEHGCEGDYASPRATQGPGHGCLFHFWCLTTFRTLPARPETCECEERTMVRPFDL